MKVLWAVLAVVAFFVASYRVWRNERSTSSSELEKHQQAARTEIAVLNEKNATLRDSVQTLQAQLASVGGAKRAKLTFHPRGNSNYIAVGATPVTTAPKQIYIEIDLAIENKGNRTSNVVRFSLDAAGTHSNFSQRTRKTFRADDAVGACQGRA